MQQKQSADPIYLTKTKHHCFYKQKKRASEILKLFVVVDRGIEPLFDAWEASVLTPRRIHHWNTSFLNKNCNISAAVLRAEREGFEPPVPLSTAVFKTAVIDHSTTSPIILRCAWCFKASAKVMGFSETSKYFRNFFQKKCIFLYFPCFWGVGSEELGVKSEEWGVRS